MPSPQFGHNWGNDVHFIELHKDKLGQFNDYDSDKETTRWCNYIEFSQTSVFKQASSFLFFLSLDTF